MKRWFLWIFIFFGIAMNSNNYCQTYIPFKSANRTFQGKIYSHDRLQLLNAQFHDSPQLIERFKSGKKFTSLTATHFVPNKYISLQQTIPSVGLVNHYSTGEDSDTLNLIEAVNFQLFDVIYVDSNNDQLEEIVYHNSKGDIYIGSYLDSINLLYSDFHPDYPITLLGILGVIDLNLDGKFETLIGLQGYGLLPFQKKNYSIYLLEDHKKNGSFPILYIAQLFHNHM